MSFNDPAAVVALLDQLRASPEWQQLAAQHPPQRQSPSVASLLSQLEPGPVEPYTPAPPAPAFGYEPQAAVVRPDPPEDRTKLSFRQSLPLVSELSDNPSFTDAVKKLKSDQDTLERRLWADREAIYAKYHDKLKNAQTKARMIGGTVSQHELNMITDAFKKEIQKFDSERVLPAWDGLVSRQQLELSQMGVPTMFVTTNVDDRERQQQVVGLLETLLGPKAAV